MERKQLASNGVWLPSNDLKKIINVLCSFHQVEKAWVYGSRALGNHELYSDIDLALEGKALNLKIRTQIEIALDDLLLPYEIDLSILSQIENEELLAHIKRVGKLVYDVGGHYRRNM